MKVTLGIVGLLFWAYSGARVYNTLSYRDRFDRIIWLVILCLIGGFSIGLLGRWSWLGILAVIGWGLLLIRLNPKSSGMT